MESPRLYVYIEKQEKRASDRTPRGPLGNKKPTKEAEKEPPWRLEKTRRVWSGI